MRRGVPSLSIGTQKQLVVSTEQDFIKRRWEGGSVLFHDRASSDAIKSGDSQRLVSCPLCPRKRTSCNAQISLVEFELDQFLSPAISLIEGSSSAWRSEAALCGLIFAYSPA